MRSGMSVSSCEEIFAASYGVRLLPSPPIGRTTHCYCLPFRNGVFARRVTTHKQSSKDRRKGLRRSGRILSADIPSTDCLRQRRSPEIASGQASRPVHARTR